MTLTQLKALLHVTAAKLDENEDDEFVLYHFRRLVDVVISSAGTSAISSNESLNIGLQCLTNLCCSPHRNELLLEALGSDDMRARFVASLECILLQTTTDYDQLRKSTISLLCNLTRDGLWSTRFFHDRDNLVNVIFSCENSFNDLLPILLNMTSDAYVRRRICASESLREDVIERFATEHDPKRLILLSGVIKNCCFEDDYHMILLDPSSKLIEALLAPLCGPEDNVDEEDRQMLPKRIQTMVGNPSTIRSDSNELKVTICQALLQLCATSKGRTRLRSYGTYFVLRELHKYECSKRQTDQQQFQTGPTQAVSTNELLFHIEQVVDQLICEERERDRSAVETSLRNIPVDPETSEKLSRDRTDYIQSD
ncbi:hypothetical protein P879_10681 [Paragonimus westermani]|uniref:Protein HGH1 homolog n=1 Tax=Paragonimus westermani TaxID=34504 RepID=A0A8T0DFZ3_9TREM|nr:hypothetical protein P879_10681 [Paragonimus westermani]